MDTTGFLDWSYAGNTVRVWILFFSIAAGGTALLVAAREVLARRFHRLGERTQADVPRLLSALLNRTRPFALAAIAVSVAAAFIAPPPRLDRMLSVFVLIAVVVQAALWASALIGFWVKRATARQLTEDAASATTLAALGIALRVGVWIIAVVMALHNLGINVTALLTGLGIGGVAIALAVQSVLGDLLAALSIVLDKPFVVGDFLVVDEHRGTVEYVGLKTTRLRSLSGEQIIVSNSDLLKSRIRNFKRMYERRIDFSVGVTYQTPHDALRRIPGMVREAIESQQNVRFDRAHFRKYGDSSLDFEMVYFVTLPDFNVYMDIQQAINLEIHRRFTEAGIEFAFPTRTIHMATESPAPAG
jgi:small-conductance mechanosensitive channel